MKTKKAQYLALQSGSLTVYFIFYYTIVAWLYSTHIYITGHKGLVMNLSYNSNESTLLYKNNARIFVSK